MNRDITKQELYEGVKYLLEADSPHLHLTQQKLFTLFSVGFQYLLFQSTKNPGSYIIRVEDSHLADKLARKAKDSSTRRFLQSLLLPRKIKYQKSTFYLDFFHIGSWALTNEIPPEKLKGALIVKNTQVRPMDEVGHVVEEEMSPELEQEKDILKNLPPDYYYELIKEVCPHTLIVAFNQKFPNTKEIEFPFIQKERPQVATGVTLSKSINLDEIDD